jgi:hypothetical protein
MSYTVNTRLNRFVWYAAGLAVSALPWKGNIRNLRKINAAGTGEVSYDPSKTVNALTTINTGDILTLDSLTTGYTIDNGAPANNSSGTKIMPVLEGPASETVTEFLEEYFFDHTCTPSVSFASGAGTLEMSFDSGATWVAMPASIDANNGFRLRVQHPNNASFSATLTLTYQ